MSVFKWTSERSDAALALSLGLTEAETAQRARVCQRTIARWKKIPAFEEEVDRLTLMTGIAGKAQRMLIAKRIIRDLVKKDKPTEKDLLDWMKYAQNEAEGIKLNLAGELAALIAADLPVAGSGSDGDGAKEDSTKPDA